MVERAMSIARGYRSRQSAIQDEIDETIKRANRYRLEAFDMLAAIPSVDGPDALGLIENIRVDLTEIERAIQRLTILEGMKK